MDAPPPLPDAAGIDAVLAWEPVLRRPAAELYEWVPSERRDDGVMTMPWVRYSDAFLGFVRTLAEHRFVVPFDWPAWAEEGVAIQRDPARLASADLETIVRLCTMHVRGDRFSEGHLAATIDQGAWLAILERLRALRPAGPG